MSNANDCEKMFFKSCLAGNLDKAKELITNPEIRLYSCSIHIFKFVCENGHLYVAQWLYSINPDTLYD